MSEPQTSVARAYYRFGKLIDRDLDGQFGRPATLVTLVGLLPFIGVAAFGRWWLIPASVFLVAWIAFVVWRAWWIFRTGLLDANDDDWIEPR